ncbi:SDR family oxidoreductase [Sporosarcina sp. P20a]|nr:SDR family oxidoreductase [Sporosarcina sp. P20a]
MKNVFGWRETGFLGFETIKELWKQGYEVSTIARNPEMMEHHFKLHILN